MAIDPSAFHRINVVDTCAVWNILSSRRLYLASKEANCDFCITSFVLYECLVKARTTIKNPQDELRKRLIEARERGAFRDHACRIDDLQQVGILEQRNRLGKGEISSLALAMKIGHAFLTDDMKAVKLGHAVGHSATQTTCHLFAWLIFDGRLTDGEKAIVITEHEEVKGTLRRHLEKAYDLALICRLRTSPH
jgi:hypothetical protein